MSEQEINRFLDTDVLVVGPTLHGAAAALAAAAAGRDTALVMRTTSPAAEIGSSMGAWLTATEIDLLPEALRAALLEGADDAVDFAGDEVILLDQRRALIALEGLLLDAGVRLFYDAHPVGLLVRPDRSHGGDGGAEAGHAGGALFGGKPGCAAATATVVLDCTVDAALARASGLAAIRSGEVDYSACFLTDADRWRRDEFAPGVTVTHRGPLAEFRFRSPDDAAAAGAALRRTIIARIASWNRAQPDAGFRIERAADELLCVPRSSRPAESPGGPVDGFHVIGPFSAQGVTGSTAPEDTPAGGRPGYLDCRTVYVPVAERLAAGLCAVDAPAPTDPASRRRGRGALVLLQPRSAPEDRLTETVSLADPSFDEPKADRIVVDLPPLPVTGSVDTVVAGGGTSGASAAIQAGRMGVETLCLEKHSDVGGVSTIGGVPAYWYGRRTPFFRRFHMELKERVRTREVPVAFALLEMIDESGSKIAFRAPVVGVAAGGGRLTYLVYASPDGLAAMKAHSFVDASGDGDLAAYAGAGYTYGAERDEITYWCSFGSFHRGRDEASRQYMSVVDTRSFHDISRGIVAGRRMSGVSGEGRYVQHYLALRESRHILGRARVTYHDVMMERAFPDAVMCCKSNIDIKGVASSRAALCGYVERSFHENYEVSIPFGALVPRDLENLVVIGKAYSISHDGLAMARMQPDMMSLGAVAAVACRAAGQRGTEAPPRFDTIDVDSLQDRLINMGALLPGDLPHGALDERVPPDDEGLAELIERFTVKPVESSEWARVFARADAAPPVLDATDVITIPSLRSQVDRIAAALGDGRGTDRLLERLDSLLEADKLPDTGALERRHDVPDHGFAPEPVYLINAVAWTLDPRLVARLERVAALITIDPSVSDHRFSYVHSIAYAAEILGTPEAGAVAASLLSPLITDRRLSGADPRPTADYVGERWAYLGLCLARAAARCGLRSGYEELARYVGELRLYLARSARRELVGLLEADHGYDVGAWLKVIEGLSGRGPLRPRPYRTAHD